MDNSTPDIARRIKLVREQRGLRQQDLADMIGYKRSYVANLESGDYVISDRVIDLISTKCNINTDWLRTGKGTMTASAAHASATEIHAIERDMTRNFLQIQRALAPSCERPGQIMALFTSPISNDMINYLASHLVDDKADKHAPDRMDALFRVAFPDYRERVEQLREQTKDRLALLEQSHIAKLVTAPVVGYAAAGYPLSDNTTDNTAEIPKKYQDDRFFVVQARGESMAPYICSGDSVVVQRDTKPEAGEPALVTVAGTEWEYTIKLLTIDRKTKTAILRSYNPEFDPMIYPQNQIIKAERIVHVAHK